MYSISNSMIETLESRRLMSVSPAILSQDQGKLQTDMATYAADTRSCDALIARDKAQVNADALSGKAHLAELLSQLQKDQATRKATVALDHANEQIAAAGDNAEIKRDDVTVRVDKKNPTQLVLDKQKLVADKIQLESDHVKFQTILLNDQASTGATILTDQQAIVEARETLSNPMLNQDQRTLLADQKNCLSTLAADQITILNDQLAITQDTATG